jgi:putative membrane protein
MILPVAALAAFAAASGCRNPDTESSSTRTTGASTITTPGQTPGTVTPGTSANPPMGMGQGTGQSMTERVGTPQGGTAPLSESDQKFLRKAASGSLVEIGEARHVQQAGLNPELKTFAGEILADHTRAHEELQKLAATKGWTLPTEVEKEKGAMGDMTKLGGAQLDKKYAKELVDDHEKDVKEFRDAGKNVSDPDLRQWAQKEIPILEGHLTKAQDLHKRIK